MHEYTQLTQPNWLPAMAGLVGAGSHKRGTHIAHRLRSAPRPILLTPATAARASLTGVHAAQDLAQLPFPVGPAFTAILSTSPCPGLERSGTAPPCPASATNSPATLQLHQPGLTAHAQPHAHLAEASATAGNGHPVGVHIHEFQGGTPDLPRPLSSAGVDETSSANSRRWRHKLNQGGARVFALENVHRFALFAKQYLLYM